MTAGTGTSTTTPVEVDLMVTIAFVITMNEVRPLYRGRRRRYPRYATSWRWGDEAKSTDARGRRG